MRRWLPVAVLALGLVGCEADEPAADAQDTTVEDAMADGDTGGNESDVASGDTTTHGGRTPALLGDRLIVAAAAGWFALESRDWEDLQVALQGPPTAPWPDGVRHSGSPVVIPRGGAAGSAEVFFIADSDGGCRLLGYSRDGAELAMADPAADVCFDAGVQGKELVVSVRRGAEGALLVTGDGGESIALDVALPSPPVASPARARSDGGFWLVPTADRVVLVDVDAASPAVSAESLPFDGEPTAVAAARDQAVVSVRLAGDPTGSHGSRLRILSLPTLVSTAVIDTANLMSTAPVLAACADPSCAGELVSSGGSHWLAGWRPSDGASLWHHADAPWDVLDSLTLGGDGRVYSGGSHWLPSDETHRWGVWAAGPEGFDVVLDKRMGAGGEGVHVASPLFSCAERTAVQVDDGTGGVQVVMTDAFATLPLAGAWARTTGDSSNGATPATPGKCEAARTPAFCGNGIVEEGEACDDGNLDTEPLSAAWTCAGGCDYEWKRRKTVNVLGVTGDMAEVRFVSDGLLLTGGLCIPTAPGPHPVSLHALDQSFTGITSAEWNWPWCEVFVVNGLIGAMPQYRGREGALAASEGQPEMCRGEMRDAVALLRVARKQPSADPERLVAVGGGQGACVALSLVRDLERTPELGLPPLRAAALIGVPSDITALHAHHQQTIDAGTPAWAVAISEKIVAALELGTGGPPAEAPVAYALRSLVPAAETLAASDTALLFVQGVLEHNIPTSQICALRQALVDAGAEFGHLQMAMAGLDAPAWTVSEPGCDTVPGLNAYPSNNAMWQARDYWLLALEAVTSQNSEELSTLRATALMADFLKSRL